MGMGIFLYPGCATTFRSTKAVTKSTWMDGGCIWNKLDTLKSICLSICCCCWESNSQGNERQVYIDHNKVTFPIILHPDIENVYTRCNFHYPISKSFDRSKPEPTPIVSVLNISLSSMEGLRQQYSAEGLPDQTTDLLESSWKPIILYHYKRGWQKCGSWCLSR